MWDFSTEPDFQEKLDWIERFMKEDVEPLETLGLDEAELARVTAPLKQQVKDAGLWACHLGPELGGQGFGQVKLGLMNELIGRSLIIGPPIFGNQAPDSGNAEILALFGTDQQKERWLWPLMDGKLRSCYSMTEPGAGSDPTLLTTRAERDGDGWVINGHKWFSSRANKADFLIVMCVTDPEAKPLNRMSMFIVPRDTPGVNIVREVGVMVGEAHHAEVKYENVRVPAEALLGGEHQAFVMAQKRLGPGRIHHAMRWLGQCHRAFDMMCERALTRFAHGSLLSEKQTVQNWIADSWTEMQAARLLTLHAAWVIDQGGTSSEARTEIAAIKFFGAKVLHDVIDRAIQVHGSIGVSTDLPLETMYKHARIARVVDGPDEVHRVTVARRVLKGYEPQEGLWPREHIPTRREAALAKFADVLEQSAADL